MTNNKIQENIYSNNLRITKVIDETTGEYTEKGVEFQNGFVQGEASGRYNMAVKLGFKVLEILEIVELETGLSTEELQYLSNRKDLD